MSDAVLTERRFIELWHQMETRMETRMDTRIEAMGQKMEAMMDKKLKPIRDTLTKIEGFQKYESDGIEYELEMILKKHMTKTYTTKTVKPFPIKTINNPYTDRHLTDLDAAFLLIPYSPTPDYERMRTYKIPFLTKDPLCDTSNIFVLAEAKHHMNRNKIATKLWQFDQICNLFALAKQIYNSPSPKHPETYGVTRKFMSTVARNQYLANIDECILFFGAAYWEKGLLRDFQADSKKYKDLAELFRNTSKENKINVYKAIRTIESKWYTNTDHTERKILDLSPEQIMARDSIGGAISCVKFIEPSGDRYCIMSNPSENQNGPSGISRLSLQGGKTRKNVGNKN